MSITYESYLRLPDLLAAQAPLTPRGDGVTWAAERFFIVCHQASELWAGQVLADLGEAAALADRGDFAAARGLLVRATSIVELLSAHLRAMYQLPREAFLRFRGALDGASGAQSAQMRELLLGERQPDLRGIRLAVEDGLGRLDLDGPHPAGWCPHGACALAHEMEAFLAAVAAWRRLHVQVARHFIGDLPGTGGTAGVRYLAGQIERAERERRGAPSLT